MDMFAALRSMRQRWATFSSGRQRGAGPFAGALLHDIGSSQWPEYILNKPGKLTEAEIAR